MPFGRLSLVCWCDDSHLGIFVNNAHSNHHSGIPGAWRYHRGLGCRADGFTECWTDIMGVRLCPSAHHTDSEKPRGGGTRREGARPTVTAESRPPYVFPARVSSATYARSQSAMGNTSPMRGTRCTRGLGRCEESRVR